MHLLPLICVTTGLALATPANALVEVAFQDGNPWDFFLITNSGCPISEADFVIDLSTSVAGVLIDTTYGGPGTQDPLPAELARGDAILAPVADGDQQLIITIAHLAPENDILLQMDVDDTSTVAPGMRISVAKSEIAGATVSLFVAGETVRATFNEIGLATLPLPGTVPDCKLLF